MKTCGICQQVLPPELFGVRRASVDGLAHKCKPCASAYQARYRREKVELVKATKRAYYEANSVTVKAKNAARYVANAEAIRAAERAKRAANPEVIRAKQKAQRDAKREHYTAQQRAGYRRHQEARKAAARRYREANLDVARERVRAYAKANPGKMRAHERRRELARIQRTPPWADLAAITAVYETAARVAELTGEPVHVGHDIPLRGKLVSGLHVHNNLVIRHATENLRKSNRFEIA